VLPAVFRMVDCSFYPLLLLFLFLGVVVPSFVCGGYHNCPVLAIANTIVFTITLDEINLCFLSFLTMTRFFNFSPELSIKLEYMVRRILI
jgi:hypothetical protein